MESKRERDDEAAAHVMAEEGSGRDGRGEGEKIWVRRRRDDIVPPAHGSAWGGMAADWIRHVCAWFFFRRFLLDIGEREA